MNSFNLGFIFTYKHWPFSFAVSLWTYFMKVTGLVELTFSGGTEFPLLIKDWNKNYSCRWFCLLTRLQSCSAHCPKDEFPNTFAVVLWCTSLDLLIWGLQNAKLKVFLSLGLLEAMQKEDWHVQWWPTESDFWKHWGYLQISNGICARLGETVQHWGTPS